MSFAASAMAGRNSLKPADFEPLTSLPWQRPGASLPDILATIFREPNPEIRYPVLAEYLHTIPVGQLGQAFDLCVALEGKQVPDDLIEFLLKIWAQRDPKECWKRTRQLFRLVGIEDGWLNYDGWKRRSPITVQDVRALRASAFWIHHRDALTGFGVGVDRSSLPENQRKALMKQFMEVWFNAFESWPGSRSFTLTRYLDFHPGSGQGMIAKFAEVPDLSRQLYTADDRGAETEAAFEIGARRLLQANPGSALEILKKVREQKWPPPEGQFEARSAGPSIELLMVWANADLPALVRWVESLDSRKDDIAFKAKGFLVNRVEADRWRRWLVEAKSDKPEEDYSGALLAEAAKWSPKAMLDAAVEAGDFETLNDALFSASFGPFRSPFNSSHFGIGVVKEFDLARLPADRKHEILSDLGMVMELWGDIDIGETARYGVDVLFHTDYAPREKLLKFFEGSDEYPDEGALIDRTFCALRVWAVVQPKPMKAWIATLKDPELRHALTWLMQHPWGK